MMVVMIVVMMVIMVVMMVMIMMVTMVTDGGCYGGYDDPGGGYDGGYDGYDGYFSPLVNANNVLRSPWAKLNGTIFNANCKLASPTSHEATRSETFHSCT